jgi:hypothetical protein
MVALQAPSRSEAEVKRSTEKILTTHVGSLPEPAGIPETVDEASRLHARVAAIVRQQRDIGIDILNEGECAKGGDWLSYLEERFSGFEQRPPKGGTPVLLRGKDREEFADFYGYAAERGTLYYAPVEQGKRATRPIGLVPARSPIAAKRRFIAKSTPLLPWLNPMTPSLPVQRRRASSLTVRTNSTKAKKSSSSRSRTRCARNMRRS